MRLVIEGSAEEIKKFINGAVSANVKVEGSAACVSAKPKLSRADVVAKAKRDVKELLSRNYCSSGDPMSFWFVSDGGKYFVLNKCKFFVNREKRTVTALIEDIRDSSIVSRGIAKCHPDDCFNADIGKAIALRRALKLEVPEEYLNAPQPEGVAIGDVVKYGNEIRKVNKPGFYTEYSGECAVGSMFARLGKVIDDTDREYRSVAE